MKRKRMRGSWLKLRAGLETQLAVFRLAAFLGVSKHEALGRIYGLASWWAEQSDHGLIKREFAVAVDHIVGKSGALEILRDEGWLVTRGASYTLARFCQPHVRKGIGKNLRAEILSASQCAACGSRFKLVVDHIIPIAKGGRTTRKNLQALCEACNTAKGAKTMAEFMEARARA